MIRLAGFGIVAAAMIIAAFSSFKDDAQKNYRESCAGCHGENLEEFYNRNWQFGSGKEDIQKIIKEGIPDMGMPAFKNTYSSAEIKAMTEFILDEVNSEQGKKREYKEVPDYTDAGKHAVRLEKVVEGLDVPWGIAFLPDGSMIITEREGKLFRFNGGSLTEISGVPEVNAKGQGGLLDVELHPEYDKNGWVYFSYSAFDTSGGSGTNTAVMRAKIENNSLVDKEVIFKALPDPSTNHHYGSRIVFDKDGYMYVSTGDRGQTNEAQKLEHHFAKIHRLHDNGSIPEDNPFVNKEGAKPSTYSYGHRNQQGIAINPKTGVLWAHEHGPKGGDELNIIKKGANYGWPVVSYGINYDGSVLTPDTAKPGIEPPIWYWVPSIAPSGMAFVSGNKYKGWEGDLFLGALRFKYLVRLELDGDKVVSQENLFEDIGRVRDVVLSPDGYIYFSVEDPGIIYKIVPAD